MTEPPGKMRPSPMATVPVDEDPSIPVLTERLTLPPLDIDFTLPAAPTVTAASAQTRGESGAPAAASPARSSTPPPAAPLPSGLDEIELRESILRDLAQRLPTDVESIVRRQMSAAIDATVQKLASEARLAIASSLREIVDRAVRAELARLRGAGK